MTDTPLFRDPLYDGAADPTLIFNRAEGSWWMVYTARRAFGPALPGTEWIHGTALGVASSTDRGRSWLYRGTIRGLELDWGVETHWAPEIVDDGREYHMYLTVIVGIPSTWVGHPRQIRHYTSPDLVDWTFRSTLELSSDNVIDACAIERPGGGWRMWFKDEDDGSHTWAADSDDLYSWDIRGPVVEHAPHECPNVFRLGDYFWMVVDEWCGQRVLRSSDLEHWDLLGHILDAPGESPRRLDHRPARRRCLHWCRHGEHLLFHASGA